MEAEWGSGQEHELWRKAACCEFLLYKPQLNDLDKHSWSSLIYMMEKVNGIVFLG